MYKIDKGIPIPDPLSRGGRRLKYPWYDMEIGDSFFVPDVKVTKINCTPAAKRTGFAFTSRKDGTGVRVWRIEKENQ